MLFSCQNEFSFVDNKEGVKLRPLTKYILGRLKLKSGAIFLDSQGKSLIFEDIDKKKPLLLEFSLQKALLQLPHVRLVKIHKARRFFRLN